VRLYVRSLVKGDVVGVGMTDAMFADTLHDEDVVTPVLRPIDHVMVRRVVDGAVVSLAVSLSVSVEGGAVGKSERL